eukprot:15092208-Alexandrium_andersonii.AAC.1
MSVRWVASPGAYVATIWRRPCWFQAAKMSTRLGPTGPRRRSGGSSGIPARQRPRCAPPWKSMGAGR